MALESGIHGVESRMRDCPEFPYMGRQGDALTTDARRNRNSLMTYFIYLGSVISNEDGSRRDNNKVRPGKV